MACSNCGRVAGCGCQVEAGTNITITGSGSVNDPWVVSARVDDGVPGPPGVGVDDVVDNGDGTFSLVLTDGSVTGPVALLPGPRGPAGADGADGVGIDSVVDDGDGSFTITLTNGDTSTIILPPGPQGPAGPQGEDGPQGEPGPAGARGALWYIGVGVPTPDSVPADANDLYLDAATGDVYTFDGTQWAYQMNIMGPTGPQGEEGPAGPQGDPGEPGAANTVTAGAGIEVAESANADGTTNYEVARTTGGVVYSARSVQPPNPVPVLASYSGMITKGTPASSISAPPAADGDIIRWNVFARVRLANLVPGSGNTPTDTTRIRFGLMVDSIDDSAGNFNDQILVQWTPFTAAHIPDELEGSNLAEATFVASFDTDYRVSSSGTLDVTATWVGENPDGTRVSAATTIDMYVYVVDVTAQVVPGPFTVEALDYTVPEL